MGRYTLKTLAVLAVQPAFDPYSWARQSIDFLMSPPTMRQSPRMASASRWNPAAKSGISSKVCPVMSKADANPFKNAGILKFVTCCALFIYTIIQKTSGNINNNPLDLCGYFMVFGLLFCFLCPSLLLLSVSGAWAFLGRPLPSASLIALYDFIEYRASFDTGFSPAVWSLTFTAVGLISSISAISFTVKYSLPFINIAYIIGIFSIIITIGNVLLNECIVKFVKKLKYLIESKNFMLTY